MITNRREGFSLFIVVLLLFLVSVYLILMFQPLFNITIASKQIEDSLKETIQDRTGLERVYSQLKDNISYVGVLSYEDIGKEYIVSTVTQNIRKVQLHNVSKFQVHNATNIDIRFRHYILDDTEDSSYSMKILHNGNIIKQYSNVDESVLLKIATDFLYAQDSNETHYGDYYIELSTDNCIVDTVITYDELDYREVLIEEGSFRRVVIVENDISIGGIKQLYIKDGDFSDVI